MSYYNLSSITKKKLAQKRSPNSQTKFIFVGGTSSNSDLDERDSIPTNSILLDKVRSQNWVKITQMHLDKDTNNYLYNLGLKPGIVVEIVSQTTSGSVIVRVGRQQIGLGADIARRFTVSFTHKQHNEN